MSKETFLFVWKSLATNLLKVLSAVPSSTVVIALTYQYGWVVQNFALIAVAVLQYTIIDVIRRRKNGAD